MTSPTMPERTTAQVVRGLVRPLYAPSAVYSIGVGAAIPAQVTVGLQCGLTPAGVATSIAASGVAMVFGTWFAGPFVERFGERAALVAATVASVVVVALLCVVLAAAPSAATAAYLATLVAFNVGDGVWGVARAEFMAAWVPPRMRGRAVNTYGASQRAGRLVGPFVGAGLIVAIGPVAGFVLHAVTAVLGCIALLTATPPPYESGRAPTGRAEVTDVSRAAWRAFWIAGIGVLALGIVRSHQEVLLPLWAARVEGLDAAAVSAATGVWMALELVLFYPAGWVLDRLGTLPVFCACLLGLGGGFALLLVPGGFWPAVAVVGLAGGIGAGLVKTTGLHLAPTHGRARFLGRWNALACTGAVVGPLLVAGAGRDSLTAAVVLSVGIALFGAGWLVATARDVLRIR